MTVTERVTALRAIEIENEALRAEVEQLKAELAKHTKPPLTDAERQRLHRARYRLKPGN